MPFGRYKGYRFGEVPSSCLDWAITEIATSDNSSPDLIRLARWAKENKSQKTEATSKYKSQGYKDPESTALNAPPPAELPPKSATQGGQALKTGTSSRYPKTKSKTAPRKKTRTLSSSEDEDFSKIEDSSPRQVKSLLDSSE